MMIPGGGVGMDPVQLRLKTSGFQPGREGNPAYTTTGFKNACEQELRPSAGKGAPPSRPKAAPRPHSAGVGMARRPVVCGRGRPPSTRDREALLRQSVNLLHRGERPPGPGTKTP